VGIDGNAVIDGTLLGRSIQAGGITAGHLAANQVLVGHTIRSSNYISGYQGWMINGVAGTAEFNNMTLNITYNDILGSKPPIDADKTSQNVAYDTTHVNGSSASTVAYNAANGATFTSSSYLNSTQQNAITSIGGGWVTTSSVGSPSGVRFTFSPSGMVLSGGSGTGNCISLQNTSARVWGYNGVAGLSGTECRLQTLSSTIGYTGGSFYPYFNGTVALGTSVSQFADLYTGGLVVNFSRVYDVIDDLETLHSIEPDAAGVMNPQTLPDDFTSRGRLRSTLRNDLGELATDEEIEEMLNDPDDMGGKIGLDLGNFVALIEGALRQLDKENSAVQYEFLNWLGDMEQRLQAIEDAA
ncbi:hypothetical protein, partial [Desulfobacter sp.]|uniref:hypothetical protein n=1 Tax=Desulfobacter sp. TaxID=2294 RepID=UPI003D10308E